MRQLALVLAALILTGTARASEPELFGAGARSPAMGATGAADSEDYEAAYVNPAGLAHVRQRRLTLGYVMGRYRLTLDGQRRGVSDTNGVILGGALPLPFGGLLKDRVAVGFAFYFPTGLINRARDAFLDQPRLALLANRTQVVTLLASVGTRVHARVSIGAGVLVLAALVGEILITPDASGRVTTVSEQQLVAGFTPVVGLRVRAAEWLRLGLAFRGQSTSGYDIQVKNDLGRVLPITLPLIRIAGTAQFDPMQLALEGSFNATRWLLVNVGATWKHWSAYPNPVENATAGAPPWPAPDYHDTVVPRAGGEASGVWGRVRLAARLGYFFEWSPAPRGGPERVLLDADRHVLTAGVGLAYRGRLFGAQLDMYGQWHHLDGDPRAGGDFGVYGVTAGIDL